MVVLRILELLSLNDLAEVVREIHTGGERQVQRSPESGVDLHQFEVVVARIASKFHHRHAMPFEAVQQSNAVLFEPGVEEALCAGAHSAARGIFPNPPVHKDSLRDAVLV